MRLGSFRYQRKETRLEIYRTFFDAVFGIPIEPNLKTCSLFRCETIFSTSKRQRYAQDQRKELKLAGSTRKIKKTKTYSTARAVSLLNLQFFRGGDVFWPKNLKIISKNK